MSKGVNKAIILGNLGNNPEIRFTQSGVCMATLSIATDESYKDKQTGQMVPKTEWHRACCGGKLAEICKDYLKKGSKIFIEGKLQTRKWQDNNGQDKYTTEIKFFEMQMLDSKPSESSNQAPQQPSGGQATPNGGQYTNQGKPLSPQEVQQQFQAPDENSPF